MAGTVTKESRAVVQVAGQKIEVLFITTKGLWGDSDVKNVVSQITPMTKELLSIQQWGILKDFNIKGEYSFGGYPLKVLQGFTINTPEFKGYPASPYLQYGSAGIGYGYADSASQYYNESATNYSYMVLVFDSERNTYYFIAYYNNKSTLEVGDSLYTNAKNGISFYGDMYDLKSQLGVTIWIDQELKDDPYSGGGTSGTGGGTGSFDLTGDAIDIPGNPTLSVVDTGFITVYNPTLAQIKNLANYLWSDLFSLDTFKKLFADPMDALIGCLIVPCSVPSAESTVMVGNISTGITMNKTSTEYVTVDCGTVNLKEYWGAYLDYAPYTKVEIYLPYIGTRQLDTDEVMGKALHVVYKVDILNGACIAYIKVGDSVLYQYSGNCGTSIPISASDFTNVINGLINAGTAIGSMVATEGATAPQAVPQLAATAVNSLKPSIEKSNGLSSTAGMMGIQKPYLIISRPRQCLPEEQVKYTGYPVYISAKLSDVTGYTEIDKIITNNISATENEMNEIINLLKTGVYL